MGGGKSIMIGNVVQQQFTSARDWPFGASLSLVLTAMVMLLLWVIMKRGGKELI